MHRTNKLSTQNVPPKCPVVMKLKRIALGHYALTKTLQNETKAMLSALWMKVLRIEM